MEMPMTNQPFAFKLQQCNVAGLALSFAVYFAGLIFFFARRDWIVALAWLVLFPCLRWALYRYFPSLSRFLGYGRVDDELPVRIERAPVAVRFYSFFSCPFCPIVLQRLEALQKGMDFTLEKIDVTLHPQLVVSKGIRSVPVIEVGDRRLVGNRTSEQLAAFIAMPHNAQPSQAA
jgi:glutaredoxin